MLRWIKRKTKTNSTNTRSTTSDNDYFAILSILRLLRGEKGIRFTMNGFRQGEGGRELIWIRHFDFRFLVFWLSLLRLWPIAEGSTSKMDVIQIPEGIKHSLYTNPLLHAPPLSEQPSPDLSLCSVSRSQVLSLY